ncbi:excinuclease ABC subunit UvrA [Alkalicoccobacillus murimartini]|uniref:UvrABC system protein A n=1 Tax=Alkalicoccobacillus murimartini TaxID=171685 RepID=A0ABT9YKE9_9BACI|nr:excinuclease ABC subunit UvrA [Alkalicoccobacillus murimartini]MDQ0208342.1 excinuclease ABC subunit A [Alkalicoccobacillus murimartini]
MSNLIKIVGASENNLKEVNVDIPRDQLVVLTGVSGSGKSSIAFNTLYAEGQMRYVESLSSYARQFLDQTSKPNVYSIEGLSPTISISQKTTSNNPRSTVGTLTEIYDHLRLLWSRTGVPYCVQCGTEIKRQSVDEMIDVIENLPLGTKIEVLAPLIDKARGDFTKEISKLKREGFHRVRVNETLYNVTEDEIVFDIEKLTNIDVVVDRMQVKPENRNRLADSIEMALGLSTKGNNVAIYKHDTHEKITFTEDFSCPNCEGVIPELSPRMFSFNNAYGACSTCTGLGFHLDIDPHKIIPNLNLSFEQDAINANGWSSNSESARAIFQALCKEFSLSLTTPLAKYSQEALNGLLYGCDLKTKVSFSGVIGDLRDRYKQTHSEKVKHQIESLMSPLECSSCQGKRLKPFILAVKLNQLSISDFCLLPINQAIVFVQDLKKDRRIVSIAKDLLVELENKLRFLIGVGLDYLTISRGAASLSGGESQRIRLASQLGSALTGVIYVLDEPSIGLHQKDNDRLLRTLNELKEAGNSLIIVEHDEDTIRAADYIIDVGPGAGNHGGEIVATGNVNDIISVPSSITGQYLSGRKEIPTPIERRKGNGHTLLIEGCNENNLKGMDVAIPLGTFTCVTGVSGSGKSSLVNEIVYKRLAADLNRANLKAGKHDKMHGIKHLDKVINVDQSPIGKTPRSNPSTYTGVFDDIRKLFALTPESKLRGYNPGRFSFNILGGRCEACAGEGLMRVEMHFLPDIFVNCDICQGTRYNRETLEITYKGKNISEVLNLSVEEALLFFENHKKIKRKINALYDAGLGYVKLGQSSTTLSGGESQRVKLASELLKPSTGSTIYILDEPTTGLHFADAHQLINVLQKLVNEGNTVLVIEHNLDLIKNADYLIDLGPEGGENGGYILSVGTPEEVMLCEESFTGEYLKRALEIQVKS